LSQTIISPVSEKVAVFSLIPYQHTSQYQRHRLPALSAGVSRRKDDDPTDLPRQFRARLSKPALPVSLSRPAFPSRCAKKAVAMTLDGELKDLSDPIGTQNAKIEIVTRDDPRALELIRHDAAHVMAEAVQELWPGTQVTIGPVIENGFYYDFKRVHPDTRDDWPFTPDDLPVIEKKMREIIARNAQFTKEVWTRDEAKTYFATRARPTRSNLSMRSRKIRTSRSTSRAVARPVPWPAYGLDRQIGDAFKLMKVAGAYWRGDSNNEMLTRIYGTAWHNEKDLKGLPSHAGGGRKARPPQAWPGNGPVPLPGRGAGRSVLASEGLGHVPVAHRLQAPPSEGGPTRKSTHRRCCTRRLWETSGHWGWYKDNMFSVQCADPESEDDRMSLR
jgi:threonyl-tRNA synthetase